MPSTAAAAYGRFIGGAYRSMRRMGTIVARERRPMPEKEMTALIRTSTAGDKPK
ncbi:hypothetical protein [Methanoculleus chikugoensis]|uniref:hypothetical protein n=1 Tax=Methanoculleus chikugoensis TaxID=118126 RepID=UPI001FB4358F|nr:hypothetical protein [Methanoculleus chikugoensis]